MLSLPMIEVPPFFIKMNMPSHHAKIHWDSRPKLGYLMHKKRIFYSYDTYHKRNMFNSIVMSFPTIYATAPCQSFSILNIAMHYHADIYGHIIIIHYWRKLKAFSLMFSIPSWILGYIIWYYRTRTLAQPRRHLAFQGKSTTDDIKQRVSSASRLSDRQYKLFS